MGFNEKVKTFRENLTQMANDGLHDGLPISVIAMSFETTLHSLEKAVDSIIHQEQEAEYNQQMQNEAGQTDE